jgi:hypothetical protein
MYELFDFPEVDYQIVVCTDEKEKFKFVYWTNSTETFWSMGSSISQGVYALMVQHRNPRFIDENELLIYKMS